MSKITVNQAVSLVPVSRATLYKDISDGTVTATINERGKKVVDVAELQRVYGKLNTSDKPSADTPDTPKECPNQKSSDHNHRDGTLLKPSEPDTAGHIETKVVALLEAQVHDLKAQLTESTQRETQLLSLLSVEQAKGTRREEKLLALLPSQPDTPMLTGQTAPPQKRRFSDLFARFFTRTSKQAKGGVKPIISDSLLL